ncbi:M16 family metallopeptidase [Pseudomonas muyukensis]|uniref:Insulinase family protein n=1 Tax=Pseudomonas muyukensis TaxID=2842357 RepID=A0ABX8MCQ9_9PSED|nr:pitrilysin family protein [Pseudomonas muyukensis]QXH36086.1 insulinase family protein [Pseudomonas muyukensis]
MPALSPPAAATSALQHFTLDNGLTVYLREDHRAPLACAQLWYHVGASHEPNGQSGLSHLLEHMMFEGSSKLAPGQYSRLISRLGGTSGAYTSHDATYFPATLPASRLEVALEAMADAMASATLGEEPFTRELAVVMAERRSQVDNSPLGLAYERHLTLAHGTSPYATPVIGHREDLAQMTTHAIRAWHRQWYRPNNATLVVVGDTTLARLKSMVLRHFNAIPAQPMPPVVRPGTPAVLSPREQTLTQPGLRNGLLISFNTASLTTATVPEQAHALRLICHLLAEGNSSRLIRRLVTEQEQLLGVRAQYDHLSRGDGLWTLTAYTSPGTSVHAAGQRVLEQIALLQESPPTAQELKRARIRLLAQQAFTGDDIEKQAQVIGEAAASGFDPQRLGQEKHLVEHISAEQLQAAAKTWLTPERMTITYLQRKEHAHA